MWREGRFLSLDDFFLRRRRGDFPVTPSMYLDRNRVLKRIIPPGYPMTFQPRIVVVRAQQDGTALDFMNRLLWILHEDRERAYGLGGPLYLFTNHFVEFMDYTSPDLFDDPQALFKLDQLSRPDRPQRPQWIHDSHGRQTGTAQIREISHPARFRTHRSDENSAPPASYLRQPDRLLCGVCVGQ